MRKMKILVIEDDVRQILWAKECLKEHELTICESEEEFLSLDPKLFDIVMTDLFLPKTKSSKPDYKIGLTIFNQLVELTTKQEIKACCLVSNFEHHCEEIDNEARAILFNKRDEWADGENIKFYFDKGWQSYTHFMSSEMKIFTKEDIRKMGEDGTFGYSNMCAEVRAVTEFGYIFLKPYSELLQKLT